MQYDIQHTDDNCQQTVADNNCYGILSNIEYHEPYGATLGWYYVHNIYHTLFLKPSESYEVENSAPVVMKFADLRQ